MSSTHHHEIVVYSVLAAASGHVPDAVPGGDEPPQPGRVRGWLDGTISARKAT